MNRLSNKSTISLKPQEGLSVDSPSGEIRSPSLRTNPSHSMCLVTVYQTMLGSSPSRKQSRAVEHEPGDHMAHAVLHIVIQQRAFQTRNSAAA